jgi:hypothetical protein
MMDDNELSSEASEELVVLQAMFPEEFREMSEQHPFYQLHVPLNNSSNAMIRWTVDRDYPAKHIPKFQLDVAWLSRTDVMSFESQMRSLFQPPNTVFLQWIDFLKDNVPPNPTISESNVTTSAVEDNTFRDERRMDEERNEFDDDERNNDNSTNISNNNNNNNNSRISHGKGKLEKQQKSQSQPLFVSGETLTDRKSHFQAHMAVVTNEADVRAVLAQLMENKKVAAATHNMYAYRIRLPNGTLLSWNEDDGEGGASERMLNLLELMKVENVLVVVSRWYGGIQLGHDRFKHIVNVAKELLLSKLRSNNG